jgi:hypothetical protein
VIGWLFAAQIAVVARGPERATACAPIEITVAARAAGATAPRIELPVTGALQVLRTSAVSRVERYGPAQPSAITEATFVVATRATGRVAMPAFVATAGSDVGRSAPFVIEVQAADEDTPTVLVRARLEGEARAPADSLFVGQQLDYVVDVQLNDAARQRLRHNPTFFPPEMPAVLAYDLPEPRAVARRGSHCFESLSYRRALFPLFPGPAVIPPAVLTYSLPVSMSFFSREESFEARTDSVRFTALEPPAQGRPADYAGAVGAVQASLRSSAASGRMGDPIVLTLRLEARGNVKLLPRPAVALDWASIARGDERVSVDTSSPEVRGAKEFDWLVTPRRAGRLVVPSIRYPSFDPARASYTVAVTDSIALDVASAALAAADTVATNRLPIRPTLGDEVPAPLPTRPWYWALLALAPVPAAMRRVLVRRRRRTAAVSPMRRLRRLAATRPPPSPRELRRAFLDVLRDRVPALGATGSQASLGAVLRRAGVTQTTAQQADDLLEQLDAAAFSPAGLSEPTLVARSASVAAAVDLQAVRPAPGRSIAPALLLAAFLAAGSVHALQDGVAHTFAEGVQAYERGDFVSAQRLFARTVARAPRAANGWADLAAAAWMRADTARAAAGWQRAVRLDPLDGELRERLATLQPPLLGAPSYVAPVPLNLLAGAVLVLWGGAWILLALPRGRRPGQGRAIAGGVLALAVVGLVAAIELADAADVHGLGALRGARGLLDTPGGTPAALAAAGEVGRLGAREGAWVRIILDRTRAGWVPVAAVLPLDADAGAD